MLAAQPTASPFGMLAAQPTASPFGMLAAQPAAQTFGGPVMPPSLNNNEKVLFLLSQAVQNSDASEVGNLLNNEYVRQNIHKVVDSFDESPLNIAIRNGNVVIFDMILQSANFDVNADQTQHYLCQAIICAQGNYAMIHTLIAKGAILDIIDDYGDPLACATTVPDKQIYDILVNAGSNPGKKYEMSVYNAPDLFTFLLKESKPLYLAGTQYRDDYVAIAKDILINHDPDLSDEAFIAEILAYCDYPELLQDLVSKGVDVNPRGIGTQTAVLNCSLDYFKQLQSYGFVDPKQTYAGQTNGGARVFADSTLLHLASSMIKLSNYDSFIDLLANMQGVDLYGLDSEGFSPLTRAIDIMINGYYPDRDICEYLIATLLKKGVDVKRPDGNGNTPLAMVNVLPNSDKIKSMIRSALGAVGGAKVRRKSQRRKSQRRKSQRRKSQRRKSQRRKSQRRKSQRRMQTKRHN